MRQLFNLINDTVPVKEIPLELDLSESRAVMKYFTDKYTLGKVQGLRKPFFKLTPHSVHVNSSIFNEVVNKLLLVFKKAD